MFPVCMTSLMMKPHQWLGHKIYVDPLINKRVVGSAGVIRLLGGKDEHVVKPSLRNGSIQDLPVLSLH